MADEPKPMDVLRRIESILVTAGEECPTNYQTQFDWEKYEAAIDKVKDAVREAMGGAYPRTTVDSFGWALIGAGKWQYHTDGDPHATITVQLRGGKMLAAAEYDYEFSPAELRAFAQLAEESGS
jgi:hypothetical protein